MRALVIEDEVRLAQTLRRGLLAQGFTVELAHNGVDGLWAATEHQVDVVVLDLMLPGLLGSEVLARMREQANWTPVLVLTARSGEHDQVDVLDLGADDYLSKPFSVTVLVARLRALVRRGAPARPAVLAAGDLTLDPARHRVHRAGQELDLTPREHALLHHLMRRAGAVTSKAEILDAVWDPAFDGDQNVVEVYIGYLRRKIDLPFGKASIETVRGVGYRLRADGG